MVFFKLLISAPHLEPLSPATKTIPAPPLLYLHPPTTPLSPLSPLSPSIHSPLLHSPSHIPPPSPYSPPRKWVTPTGSGQSHTFRTPSITKLGDSRPLILSLSLCKNNIYLFKYQTLSFFSLFSSASCGFSSLFAACHNASISSSVNSSSRRPDASAARSTLPKRRMNF